VVAVSLDRDRMRGGFIFSDRGPSLKVHHASLVVT
jgi:hypothetical protein